MATRYARIFGTEEDKVNCPFYYKIGACRHGDRCSRVHMKPTFSQTVMIPHMYAQPTVDPETGQIQPEQEHFEEFYEEILEELAQFGVIEELNVVQNLGDHLFGNVYVKYRDEEAAARALQKLQGRYYGGRLLTPGFSPVTDFREARCRQFDEDHCARGGYCNFMHLKVVPRHLRKMREKLNRKMEREENNAGGRVGREREREIRKLDRADSPERRRIIATWNVERYKKMLVQQKQLEELKPEPELNPVAAAPPEILAASRIEEQQQQAPQQ